MLIYLRVKERLVASHDDFPMVGLSIFLLLILCKRMDATKPYEGYRGDLWFSKTFKTYSSLSYKVRVLLGYKFKCLIVVVEYPHNLVLLHQATNSVTTKTRKKI